MLAVGLGCEVGEAVGRVVGSCVALAPGWATDKAVGRLVLAGAVALWGEQEHRPTARTNRIAILMKGIVFIATPLKGAARNLKDNSYWTI